MYFVSLRLLARHCVKARLGESHLNLQRVSNGLENPVPEAERYVGAVLSVRGAEACVGILVQSLTMPDGEGPTVGQHRAIVSHNSILI
jgi:hypothetical protein